MPRTREQFDQMRAKSRQTIMESALELFTHKGYHGTSVSMIANQAGVSAGLMYNYFQSKDELLEAIVRDGMTKMESLMGEVFTITEPRKQLRAMIDLTFRIALEDMRFWSLYFSLLMLPDLPENVTGIFGGFIEGMFAMLEDLFKRLRYKNPQEEAKLFGALLDGIMLHYWMVGDKYPLENVRKYMLKKYHVDKIHIKAGDIK